MHALDGLFQKASSIVSRKIADEMILVPIRRKVGEVECLYTLNEVAARVWELLDGKTSLQAVRDTLFGEFAVGEQEAREDLMVLIEQLQQIGAIEKVA